MQPVNYDLVASVYGRRYERHRYDGVRAYLHGFVGGVAPSGRVAEAGCGTGHWLADLSDLGFRSVAGLDVSARMLEHARAAAPGALLVRGTATQLPWRDGSLDRVFSVNALHHFPDPRAFISECRRVLRPEGRFLTVGLDPHHGEDEWWIYDFFPTALAADRVRYAAAGTIRKWLTAAGFKDPVTEVAQRSETAIPFDAARRQGFLERRSTSQLIVIGDDEYAAGMARLRVEQPALRVNIRLYATTAQI